MEIQIKRTVKSGNSSAVILPRSWLNKEVRVELVKKTPELILKDVIDILKKSITLDNIIGIYLVGSYARGEEDETSDIDVLVITRDINKELISEGIYNILIVSQELLKEKLKKDLFPLGQMTREAKPLLNSSFLDSIESKVTGENIKWHIKTTEEKLKLIQRIINLVRNEKCLNDRIAYTLILRIRTMYVIRKLIENKSYSKKKFISLIEKVSGGKNAYERYLIVKNNLPEKDKVRIGEIKKLYEYLKQDLVNVKKLVRDSS